MNDLREVDLERGMPRAEQAIRQMLFELRRSPGLGCSAVKLIHGYGSSGAGGAGASSWAGPDFLAALACLGALGALPAPSPPEVCFSS